MADDEFGRVTAFRAKLRARKERYVLDVPCNTRVRIPAAPPTALPQQTTSKTGATRTGATQKRPPPTRGRPRLPAWVRVDQWAAEQPAAAWQRIEVRPGEKGPLCVDVLHAHVQTDTKKTAERLLVIRTVEAHPLTHDCVFKTNMCRLDESVRFEPGLAPCG